MEFFPDMSTFLKIGNIQIKLYAVCILTGAMIAYYFFNKQARKAGYSEDIVDDLFIGIMIFGIIGCRLWYVLFYNLKGYLADPISIIRIWDGGLAIQGGLIFGAMFVYVYLTMRNIDFLHIADMILPYVLIAQACGRWGNYFNQEAFGDVVKESYFDGILSFLKEGMYISGAYRRPMFFWESLLCIVGFILIMLYRKYSKYHRGDSTFCYLMWYGAVRFWIESKRTDSLMIGNFKTAQIVSVVFMIIGLLGLSGVFKKYITKEKPLIVFDFDGTLLDTYPVICASFQHVFDKYAPDLKLTDADKASFCGPTLEETFAKYVPEGPMEEMVEMYREHNYANQEKYVKAFPHVKELLDFLIENGYAYCIASSKITKTIREGLRVTNLNDYFSDEQIIGFEQITVPKPDPETINKALKALGAKRSNAVYVGDSLSDIKAAQNAGIFSIAYCTNEYKREDLTNIKPNKMINSLQEIEEILKEDHPWTSNMM